jgi:hypothetical protein
MNESLMTKKKIAVFYIHYKLMMDGCEGSRHRALSFPSTRLGKDYAFI